MFDLPGLRCLTIKKNVKTKADVTRAVGQLHKNMAATERLKPNKLNHLL
jgi:hypothetical protein